MSSNSFLCIHFTSFTGKYIDIEPHYLAMTSSYVFAASKENFYLWHFKTPKAHSSIELISNRFLAFSSNF